MRYNSLMQLCEFTAKRGWNVVLQSGQLRWGVAVYENLLEGPPRHLIYERWGVSLDDTAYDVLQFLKGGYLA